MLGLFTGDWGVIVEVTGAGELPPRNYPLESTQPAPGVEAGRVGVVSEPS